MLEELPSELLCAISQHITHPEDLLRLSRASKRCYDVVTLQCQETWKKLYFSAHFPTPGPSTKEVSWLELYRDRYVVSARDARLERRVRFIRLHSKEQTLQRELYALHSDLAREQRGRQASLDEIRELKHAQQINALPKCLWTPTSVQQSFERVVSAAPVDIQSRIAQLDNDIKVMKLNIQMMANSTVAKQRELEQVRGQLQAMQG